MYQLLHLFSESTLQIFYNYNTLRIYHPFLPFMFFLLIDARKTHHHRLALDSSKLESRLRREKKTQIAGASLIAQFSRC